MNPRVTSLFASVMVCAFANGSAYALSVAARQPIPGTVGSKIQGEVVIVTFSEAVDPVSVDGSSFTLQSAAGAVSGTISFAADNTQAIFTPSAPLAFDQSYTVTLTTAVRDPANNALPADDVWRFNTGKKLAVGFKHTCARTDDGRVKCWGLNNYGQLGYDDTQPRGNGTGQKTNELAGVNLGEGRTAVAVAAGDNHTCAILDNGDTKCWGRNNNGQLGQGDVGPDPSLGDESGEMAMLPPINFGPGRRAIDIAAGQIFTCARLDDNSVKCWGGNSEGQLGQGNTVQLGVVVGDLAAAAPINLGTGLTPTALSLAQDHACAILADAAGANHVKCWGDNRWGQLGLGIALNDHRGDAENEMGDSLPEVNLGTGLSATDIQANGGHTCVVLSDQSIKCWGLNTWGQVGLNAGNNAPADRLQCAGPSDCIGDDPAEMGDALPAAIAAGSAMRLASGFRHTCALLTSGELKCWGSNEHGELGIGDNMGNNVIIGDQPGEMAALATTVLKSSAPLEELTAGGFHNCVWHADKVLNCWGENDFGQLGRNDILRWGDNPGEMGPGLVDVDLGP
jgi:alpha-tubulin suppressor-like RCC1 family protein